MSIWAEELQRGGLGDRRLWQRLQSLVGALVRRPEVSLPQLLPDWPALKAAYRFFANRRLTPAAILASERPATLARLGSYATVLIVQDTTALDFSHHPATGGLGSIGTHGTQRGILLHTALAVSPEGTPLGLLAQELWTRPPERPGRALRRQRPAAEKESARWARVEAASLIGLPAAVQAVTIADREADLFALFAAARPPEAALLIRAAQATRLVVGGALLTQVQAAACLGRYTVSVLAAPGRAARQAVCRIQATPVALQQPVNRPAGTPRQAPVPLWAVLVTEQEPPAGVRPLSWLLLSTLAAPNLEAAAQLVYWYSLRWQVERYHLALKTGCRVEALQLQQEERLERAVAVYALVAWRLLWLTHLAREQPDAPAEQALTRLEWQLLSQLHSGSTTRTPPTLRQVVRWLAQLGGFLGRRGDGEPGVLTLWRGFARLQDLVAGFHLAQPPPQCRCG